MLPDRQLAAQPIERRRIVAHDTGHQTRWKQSNANVLRSMQHNGIDALNAEAADHFYRCCYGSRREYRLGHRHSQFVTPASKINAPERIRG